MTRRGILAMLTALAVSFTFWRLFSSLLIPLQSLQPVSDHFLSHGVEETGAINIVCSVLLDYRGFDTLGETMVILASVTTVSMLFRGLSHSDSMGLSLMVKRSIGYMAPLFWIFAICIIMNGHLSPGGGFQGGVILAAMTILFTVVFGVEFSAVKRVSRYNQIIEYICAFGFILTGLWGLMISGAFLGNLIANFPAGRPGTLYSAGFMLLLNILIGLKVMAGLSSIFLYLQKDAGHVCIDTETEDD